MSASCSEISTMFFMAFREKYNADVKIFGATTIGANGLLDNDISQPFNAGIFSIEPYIKEVNGKEGWNVITGTGSAHYDEIVEELKSSGIETADNIDIRPYIRDMHVCMNGADVVIGRAGALSVAETTICGRAAVFVPYPEATGNHQYFNAKAIAEAGGAILAEEKDLDVDEVAEKIKALKDNREELEAMSRASLSCSPKGATDKIYEEIKETLQK